MSTAIFVHGQFLMPRHWKPVMWGNPRKNLLGEIPCGIRTAIQYAATHLFVCSAVPDKGGRKYSPDARKFAEKHLAELQPDYQPWVSKIIQIENVQNTVQEIERADMLCKSQGIESIFFISAPKHMPRISRDVLIAKHEKGMFKNVDLNYRASDVEFPTAKVKDVAVTEPSHRHDVPRYNYHLLAAADLNILKTGDRNKNLKYLRRRMELLESFGIPINFKPLGSASGMSN